MTVNNSFYVVSLDLGTQLGWAAGQISGKPKSGHISLKNTRYDVGETRFFKFKTFLDKITNGININLVTYEKVTRHLKVDAAHLYGGFVATLLNFCAEKQINCVGVNWQDIKKFATGKGNATKLDMINSLQNKYNYFDLKDDNEADALALWHYTAKLQ